MASSTIFSLDDALLTVKEGSRAKYKNVWLEFVNLVEASPGDFVGRNPSEGELISYFKHLRENKKMVSSSMWTYYSMINSIYKGMYGKKLQDFPRITRILKTFDTDIKKKAMCFESEDMANFVKNESYSSPYWLVRKVVLILSFFGGLRHQEVSQLELQNCNLTEEGIYITHFRVKQRSDKTSQRFLVPRSNEAPNYAAVIEDYLSAIKQVKCLFVSIQIYRILLQICMVICILRFSDINIIPFLLYNNLVCNLGE